MYCSNCNFIVDEDPFEECAVCGQEICRECAEALFDYGYDWLVCSRCEEDIRSS